MFFVLSFSLTIAPAAFMEIIKRVIQNNLDSFFIVFIDGKLVYFKNDDDQMGHLRVVLQTF